MNNDPILAGQVPLLGGAFEAFFCGKDLAPISRRAYRQTLDALIDVVGAQLPANNLTVAKLRRALEQRWGEAETDAFCPFTTPTPDCPIRGQIGRQIAFSWLRQRDTARGRAVPGWLHSNPHYDRMTPYRRGELEVAVYVVPVL